MNKNKLLPLFGSSLALLLGLGSISSIRESKAEDDFYVFGTRIEAEDCASTNCLLITNNGNASGKRALDTQTDGYIEFEVNIEDEGYYDIVLGYYTGMSGTSVLYTINGLDDYLVETSCVNGWCKDTARLPQAVRTCIHLNEGMNNIKIAVNETFVNFDFVVINEVNTNFLPNETNYIENVGSYHIEAELAIDTYGDFVSEWCNIQKAEGSASNDFYYSIDDNVKSKPTWNVIAPTAGQYELEIGYIGWSSELDADNYSFKLNETSFDTLFPKVQQAGDRAIYRTLVNLNAGLNVLSYTRPGGTPYIDFDYFRFLEVPTTYEFGEKIEAEDHISGGAIVQKHESKYPCLSNYASEGGSGLYEFKVNAPSEGKYKLYAAAYTESSEAFVYCSINDEEETKVSMNGFESGWLEPDSSVNFAYFEVDLKEGENLIKIRKGEDTDQCATNYVDFDYFVVIDNDLKMNEITLTVGDELALSDVYSYSSDVDASVVDVTLASVTDNKIVTTDSGSTSLLLVYELFGETIFEEVPLNINKTSYEHIEDLKVFDTTVNFDGTNKYIRVEYPSEEGWEVVQDGIGSEIGEYDVTITFKNDAYADVIKHAKLKIVSGGEYIGDDLIVNNLEVHYDGNGHAIVASAPIGWEIVYSIDIEEQLETFIEVGEYSVTVTFKNDRYSDVVKTVTLTILKPLPKNQTGLIVGLSVGGGVVLASGIAIGVMFIVKAIKRKKYLRD